MNVVTPVKSNVSPASLQEAARPLAQPNPAQPFFRLLLNQVRGDPLEGAAPKLPNAIASSAPVPPGRGASRSEGGPETQEEESSARTSLRQGSDWSDALPRRYFGTSGEPAGELGAWFASTAPLPGGNVEPPEAARSAASLEDLLPVFVRRVAWSSDGKRGTARLEIGSGHLAGATLLVHAEAGRVRVLLDAPPGADLQSWRERILQRLASRNIPVEGIEVS
jgi:hypothetical protein